jgi:DNA polymerase III alpha subunit
MSIIKPPTKFVGLHAHTNSSIGDAIGLPKEHIDFALENEMDALAVTDHGNMNSFSHQYIYWSELKKRGVNFKAIPGCETYFVDSLQNWQSLYDADRLQKETAKLEKKSKSKKLEDFDSLEELSDQHADTKSELDELTEGGAIVENEEESKKSSWRNPLTKRSHLVLLPKNQEGLNSLFNMISLSYSEGFYRFPRIDMDMLRKHSNGNLIASTACLSGDSILITKNGMSCLSNIVLELRSGKVIEVLSYNEQSGKKEFHKITWGEKTKTNAMVYEIVLADGKAIKATLEHRFLTDKGWLSLEDILKLPELPLMHTI